MSPRFLAVIPLLFAACSSPTELVVVVDSQLDPSTVGWNGIYVVGDRDDEPRCSVGPASSSRFTLAVRSSRLQRVTILAAVGSGSPPADCLDSDRSILASTAAQTEFVLNARTVLHLSIQGCCQGVDCPVSESCQGGECMALPFRPGQPWSGSLTTLDASGPQCDRVDGGTPYDAQVAESDSGNPPTGTDAGDVVADGSAGGDGGRLVPCGPYLDCSDEPVTGATPCSPPEGGARYCCDLGYEYRTAGSCQRVECHPAADCGEIYILDSIPCFHDTGAFAYCCPFGFSYTPPTGCLPV